MKKLFWATILLFPLITGAALMTPSESNAEAQTVNSQHPQVKLNGYTLPFPADQKPFLESGRVQIPVRAIFEMLGAQVTWDSKTNTVTGVKGSLTVRLTITSRIAYVNGAKVALEIPARLINDHMYVPMRFVSESLGAQVGWEESTDTVKLIVGMNAVVVPNAASLSESVKRELPHRSEWEQARLALFWLYGVNVSEGPYLAPHLLARLAAIHNDAAKKQPQAVSYEYLGDGVEGGKTCYYLLALVKEADGTIRPAGLDVVQLSQIDQDTGSIVTGYAHVPVPHSVTMQLAASTRTVD